MNYEELIDALDSVTWYNGLAEYLLEIKKELINSPDYTDTNYIYDYGDNEQFQIIWIILVCLFGDYGTSPRYRLVRI